MPSILAFMTKSSDFVCLQRPDLRRSPRELFPEGKLWGFAAERATILWSFSCLAPTSDRRHIDCGGRWSWGSLARLEACSWSPRVLSRLPAVMRPSSTASRLPTSTPTPDRRGSVRSSPTISTSTARASTAGASTGFVPMAGASTAGASTAGASTATTSRALRSRAAPSRAPSRTRRSSAPATS